MSSAADTWSASSAAYATKLVEVTSEGGQLLLGLINGLRPFDAASKVLDSGAGSGALTSLLREKSGSMSIVAADVAPGMLEQLKKRKLPNVETLVLDAAGDYIAQGLQAGSFSHVVSTFMLQFIMPAQKAFTESFRILEPGGVIGSAIWSKNDLAGPWNTACKNLDASFEPSDSIFQKGLSSVGDMEAACEKAGFVDCLSLEGELCLRFDDAETFVDYFMLSRNPPCVAAMSTWRGKPEDVRDEFIKVTRNEFNNGKIYMTAACTVARKP